MPPPSPAEQIEFLQKIQRILSEGRFSASYKYALLRSLAYLAVLQGDDSGVELSIKVKDIATSFIRLYWQQTKPFVAHGAPEGWVLLQNNGAQAAIIKAIIAVQSVQGVLSRLERDIDQWEHLVGDIIPTVVTQPLWKLQEVGDDEVDDFLYTNVGGNPESIILKPGVAYCLRNFYGLLKNLIDGAWASYLHDRNLRVFGQSSKLRPFLFETKRGALNVYRETLNDIQGGRCFYCHGLLRGPGHVDHFIPWSKYPIDLGHNFVLAHEKCNGKKNDFLAAEEHLEAWVERNNSRNDELKEFFTQEQLAYNLKSSISISRWAYTQTANANGLVWLEGAADQRLGARWEVLLSGAQP